MRFLLLICCGAAALATGCASGPEPVTLEGHPGCKTPDLPAQPTSSTSSAPQAAQDAPPLLARVWLCNNTHTVTLYPKAGHADIVDRGCQMRLAQVPAASGTRYENEAAVFWDKGSAATLQRKPGRQQACREIVLMSQIEDARIRGVTWRGHDVEGKWHINIGPGPGLTLVQAGKPPIVFARPTSVSDPNTNTTVYTARQGADAVSVKVTDLLCRDRAGNTLPNSVDIVLNGNDLEGCGLALTR